MRVLHDAPAGFLTAQQVKGVASRRSRRLELWPRTAGANEAAAPAPALPVSSVLTYRYTARRSFETAYWNAIKRLATGRFINKDNADCVLDAPTQRRLRHRHRDLDSLADYLVDYYETMGAAAGTTPFRWTTDFPFDWSEGWLRNQKRAVERNVIVRIPGRDRSRAIIMADHYDTAYTRGEIRGVVESVDLRRGTMVLNDDISRQFVTVTLPRDRRLDDVRPGDYVEFSGDWSRRGIFEAYRLERFDEGRN